MDSIRFGDRVHVPGGRTGEVVGFYRTKREMALVRFDDGERRRVVLSEVKLATENDQTLLHEITVRVRDSSDGFTVVMPVSEWIDALWPASERAAEAEK
jgi:hypothetical protein